MARRILHAVFGRGHSWSKKQVEVLTSRSRVNVVNGGRRFGKTKVGAAKFIIRVLSRMHIQSSRIKDGHASPWPGIGLKASRAKILHPDIECWIVTPRERHLEQCRNYILEYFRGAYRCFQHPELALFDGGKQMLFIQNGASCRIRFVVGASVASMVSGGIHVLWVDEAGLVDGSVIEALRPVTWECNADEIYSGTPSLGTEHWFSRLCLSGLDESHPYYEEGIVDKDPDVHTVIGTSFEAFLGSVRKRAKEDSEKYDKSWVDQWLMGDWRLPSLFVYDNFDKLVHVVDYNVDERIISGLSAPLPPPSIVVGCIDWAYSATKPGACVVFHVWLKNPLVDDRTRPLVIAVKDCQEAKEYTADGWYSTFRRMRDEYGVRIWYCDPSRDEMIMQAKRFGGRIGRVVPASKADKQGRILLVKSLLHHDRSQNLEPSFYISKDGCSHLPRQFSRYRRAVDMRGNVLEKTIDYDDHCLDCCAFLMGKIMGSGYSIPTIGV